MIDYEIAKEHNVWDYSKQRVGYYYITPFKIYEICSIINVETEGLGSIIDNGVNITFEY